MIYIVFGGWIPLDTVLVNFLIIDDHVNVSFCLIFLLSTVKNRKVSYSQWRGSYFMTAAQVPHMFVCFLNFYYYDYLYAIVCIFLCFICLLVFLSKLGIGGGKWSHRTNAIRWTDVKETGSRNVAFVGWNWFLFCFFLVEFTTGNHSPNWQLEANLKKKKKRKFWLIFVSSVTSLH